MNKLKIISLALAFTFVTSGVSFASYGSEGCQPIYGGGENCITKGKIELNKTVQDPKSKDFVDNLGRNNTRLSPSQTVTFKLSVTNTGDKTLSEVVVSDTFPQFTSFVSGPGNFDSASQTLTFKVFNLNPSETRTYTVIGKVAEEASLPQDSGINCVVNQSKAVAEDNVSEDNAGFCIEKGVATTKGGLPVMPAPKMQQTPATGPEMLPLLGLIPAGLSGLFLRRRSSK